jgi:hypothetical protein
MDMAIAHGPVASGIGTRRRAKSLPVRLGRALIEALLQRLERRIERAVGRLDRAGLLDRNGRTRRETHEMASRPSVRLVPTDGRARATFRHHVTVLWQRTLRRRSQKDRTSRDRMAGLMDDGLPRPRSVHPWPSVRFAVRHPGWEP